MTSEGFNQVTSAISGENRFSSAGFALWGKKKGFTRNLAQTIGGGIAGGMKNVIVGSIKNELKVMKDVALGKEIYKEFPITSEELLDFTSNRIKNSRKMLTKAIYGTDDANIMGVSEGMHLDRVLTKMSILIDEEERQKQIAERDQQAESVFASMNATHYTMNEYIDLIKMRMEGGNKDSTSQSSIFLSEYTNYTERVEKLEDFYMNYKSSVQANKNDAHNLKIPDFNTHEIITKLRSARKQALSQQIDSLFDMKNGESFSKENFANSRRVIEAFKESAGDYTFHQEADELMKEKLEEKTHSMRELLTDYFLSKPEDIISKINELKAKEAYSSRVGTNEEVDITNSALELKAAREMADTRINEIKNMPPEEVAKALEILFAKRHETISKRAMNKPDDNLFRQSREDYQNLKDDINAINNDKDLEESKASKIHDLKKSHFERRPEYNDELYLYYVDLLNSDFIIYNKESDLGMSQMSSGVLAQKFLALENEIGLLHISNIKKDPNYFSENLERIAGTTKLNQRDSLELMLRYFTTKMVSELEKPSPDGSLMDFLKENIKNKKSTDKVFSLMLDRIFQEYQFHKIKKFQNKNIEKNLDEAGIKEQFEGHFSAFSDASVNSHEKDIDELGNLFVFQEDIGSEKDSQNKNDEEQEIEKSMKSDVEYATQNDSGMSR
jgi:hypothetical protein